MARRTSRVEVGSLQFDGQAARLGIKPGDVLVSYHGRKTASRRDIQVAKRQAVTDKAETIRVVFRRGDRVIQGEFRPGPMGFAPSIAYDDPTFK